MEIFSFFSVFLLGAVLALAFKGAPNGLWGKPLVSCYTVVLGLFAIYYLMPAALLLIFTGGRYLWLPIYSGTYSVAITGLVATFAVVMFVGGYALRNRGPKPAPTIAQPVPADPLAMQIAWMLVVVGIMLKIYVITNSGGLEMTIMRQSGGITENLRLDEVSAFLSRLWMFSSMADAAITWILIRRMQLGRSFLISLLVFTLVIVLSFVGTGKRLYVLWPLLAFGLGIHFYVKPLRLTHLPIAALLVLGLGFATLMFRIYAPANLANVNIDLYRVPWAEGSLFRFYFMSAEFASFELLTLAIENPELIVRQFGGAWQAFVVTNIEPFAYFVPRDIWPGKPDVLFDMSHANRVVMVGGTLDSAGGVASMLPGTSWTLAGPLGLAIAMGVLGWLSAAADGMRSVRGLPDPLILLVYALINVTIFHLFRQGTIAWTAMIVVAQQLGLIAAFILLFAVDWRNRASLPLLSRGSPGVPAERGVGGTP